MDWINLLTRDIASGSIIAIFIAAGITCWRAGSFHPINVRLLRFFINRDEIEDPVIKKSLADQSALVSFRTTYGVRVETLADARALAEFADLKNVPLALIGRAKGAFDLKNLAIIPKRVPSKVFIVGPAIALMALVVASLVAATAATRSDLLVQLKKTDTLLWLSHERARTPFPHEGRRREISRSDCNVDRKDLATPKGFQPEDLSILCDIWKDPSLEEYLAKETREQRKILLVALAVLAWYAFMVFGLLRQCIAQIELASALKEDQSRSEVNTTAEGT